MEKVNLIQIKRYKPLAHCNFMPQDVKIDLQQGLLIYRSSLKYDQYPLESVVKVKKVKYSASEKETMLKRIRSPHLKKSELNWINNMLEVVIDNSKRVTYQSFERTSSRRNSRRTGSYDRNSHRNSSSKLSHRDLNHSMFDYQNQREDRHISQGFI
jgi:hypothetical protein